MAVFKLPHGFQTFSHYSELSLRRTPSGPAQTVHLREVSVYREFRYSNMTEKWCTGTNTKCLSYRGVRLIGVRLIGVR